MPLLSYDPNVPPVIVPWYSLRVSPGAIAGQRARAELIAGGNGLWFYGMNIDAEIAAFDLWTIAAATSLVTSISPTSALACAWGDGSNAQATVDFGTRAADETARAWRVDLGHTGGLGGNIYQLWLPEPFYLAAGRVLVMQYSIDQVAVNWTIHWREVPS